MRGLPIFLIFAPKHRLWVLVRTALAEKYQFFSAENFQFLKLKKYMFIAWASFHNDAHVGLFQYQEVIASSYLKIVAWNLKQFVTNERVTHYENMPMQYTEIF